MILLKGNIHGEKEVAYALGRAPTVMTSYLRAALFHERKVFIGTTGRGASSSGYFRRAIERKGLWGGRQGRGGETTWSRQVSGLFQGRLTGGQRIEGMQMRMGVLYTTQKQMHRAMELLGQGGITTAREYMLIPFAKNLAAIGVKPLAGNVKGAFQRMAAMGHPLEAIHRGGNIYYLDRKMPQGSQIMFMGVHSARVRKAFDFEGSWNLLQGAAMDRIRTRIDRGVTEVKTGRIGG